MNRLRIQIDGGQTHWQPGGRMSGAVTWDLAGEKYARALEVRLIWFTSGGCAQQVGRVETLEHLGPTETGTHRFTFVLPDRPWSFQGRLARLQWAVEAVLVPGGGCARVEFTLGPNGRAVCLAANDPTPPSLPPPLLRRSA